MNRIGTDDLTLITTRMLIISTVVLIFLPAARSEDYFDPDSIEKHGNKDTPVDVSSLSHQGGQVEGIYLTEIYLNGNFITERKVKFRNRNNVLAPDISKQDLTSWGVKKDATADFFSLKEGVISSSLNNFLPGSRINYNFNQQRLDLSVPQEYIEQHAQGEVSPSEWDEGVNSGFTSYSYSGSSTRSKYRSGTEQNNYLNLRSGVNVGAWRLRNYSTWSHTQNQNRWNSINTYLQRDIKTLKAQFVAGDSYTPSDVFDSFAFRGLQLYSDDNMQPESLRGFAPVIRGIAQSNARITVRQDGNMIYQAYVPAGPFSITDLYPTAASGDLNVTIQEANGSIRQFTQAFSAVPVMLRQGRLKYSVTAGKYRLSGEDTDSTHKPPFILATSIYGLQDTTTLYGGTLISPDYTSESMGIGQGLGDFGSVSFDTTWANTQFTDAEKSGASFRFQYAKDFNESGTSLTMAGYRYSTSGYYDFNEANGYYNNSIIFRPKNDDIDNDLLTAEQDAVRSWRNQHNKRSKTQLNINQGLNDFGSVYFSIYQQQYWGVSGKENNASLGYNFSENTINYSLNFTWSQSPFYQESNKIVSFAVQIPFDRFMPKSWLNATTSYAEPGQASLATGLSGIALDDNNLSYNVQQGYTTKGIGVNGNASADYKVSFGEYQAGYNYTEDSHQINYGTSGGVIVHPYGITFSQPLGDTFAIIKADKASGIKVENNAGVYTDSAGYAAIPYVTPYRRNVVTLDTSHLNKNTEIPVDTRFVIPDQGAIVMAKFSTVSGMKVLMKIQSSRTIPLGAIASVRSNETTSTGIMDDRQRVYLSGVQPSGIVTITWNGGTCQAAYSIQESRYAVSQTTAVCK
ncbi:fimbrial biogenesis outer membrane usher protein [Pantoea ananatis]|uniref:fimbria/pilus outer membrane usher protein n=1 Tax=Pantoea ananas TaxID=553 RepID=UPI00158A3AE5|nr:fimbria/pilus outer membrane usher protein [Pantoea ananatis]MBA4823477.1 fimbrial biogenesis outer membrane usher protein [Pantoea ananatis]QKV88019.1 fimbrial biogenesis outer membrane usher protein [Pantoea ananatis]